MSTENSETGKPVDAVENGVAGMKVESPNETPAAKDTTIKDTVASAPQAENGYVPPTSAAEVSYESELAARIEKSNFAVTRVSHVDFVKMNAAGLIDFETKKLLTGQQLVIEEGATYTGTYFEQK